MKALDTLRKLVKERAPELEQAREELGPKASIVAVWRRAEALARARPPAEDREDGEG